MSEIYLPANIVSSTPLSHQEGMLIVLLFLVEQIKRYCFVLFHVLVAFALCRIQDFWTELLKVRTLLWCL